LQAHSLCLGGNRLAIVLGLGEMKPFDKLRVKNLAGFLQPLVEVRDITVLLSEENKLGKDFNFLLKKQVLSQEFSNLTIGQFRNFIIKEGERREVELDDADLRSLANIYLGDSWGLVTELDKMALAIKPTSLQANPSIGGERNDLWFQLRKIANSRVIASNLPILEKLLISEDPAKIFNLLAYQARDKSKFADYDAAVKSGKLDYEAALTDLVLN